MALIEITVQDVIDMLHNAFMKNAKNNFKPATEMQLRFRLKNLDRVIVESEVKNVVGQKKEIDIIPAKYFLFAGKIHKAVAGALQKFATLENVELQKINFVLDVDQENNLRLNLMNARQSIRPITVDELLK
jgi:hypothetical protein